MRTKSKKIRGGNLSVSDIESIINDINNNYGIKKEGTDIYVNIDSDIDELKNLLSMSEEGIDEYFKNKVNDVKSVLELLNTLKNNVEDSETINKLKSMDMRNLPSSIRNKLQTMLNGVSSIESVIPVAPPMESVIPVAPPMESVIPVAPPMESVVPVAPPMESVVPVASPRNDLLNDITKGFKLKKVSTEPTKQSPLSGLLGDIEKGVTLKKVSASENKKKEEPTLKLSPLAQEMIARRSALVNKDDDDDSWQGGSVIRFTRRTKSKSKSKRNSKKVKSHRRRRSLKK